MRDLIKSGNPYIYRFWTGIFRLVSTCYKSNPVSILHISDEKRSGMVKLYNIIKTKKRFPSAKRCFEILHLKYPSIATLTKIFIKDILYKIRKRK